MKKIIAILLIMLMLVMLVVGCVSRQDFDALMVEHDGLRVRVESAENDLVGTQVKNSELTSSLEGSQTELEGAKGELAAAQTKNSELTSSLEGSQTELEGAKGELAAAQAKNSELPSSLEKSQTELKTIKTEKQDLEQANEELKRFNFFKTALCSSKPEPGNVRPKPNNTFKTNETVWVYIEYFGYKYTVVGEELQPSILTAIEILDADGKVVKSSVWTYTPKWEYPYGFIWTDKSFGSLEAGNYTVKVEVADNNSGETITWEEEFQVV